MDIEKLNPDSGYVDTKRWFRRYELFMNLQLGLKEENEVDRFEQYLTYLPLYIAGSALLCFEELPAKEQEDYALVKTRLASYHELDEAQAYSEFVECKYGGEGVDVCIARLRRYMSTLHIEGEVADRLILQQFMRSIPVSVATELRTRCSKEDDSMDLQTVITTARHLQSLQAAPGVDFVGAVGGNRFPKSKGKGKGKGQPSAAGEHQKKTETPQKKTECFVCGEGHYMKECPLIKSLIQGNGVGSPLGAAKVGHQTNPAVQH